MGTDRANRGIFLLRAFLGLGFLFAGLERYFMWASGTPFTSKAFLQSGTTGAWLGSGAGAVVNPTHGFWAWIAGHASLVSAIDYLVVFGELAIGVALILGVATRLAALMGTILMALIYVAAWSFADGPFNEVFFYGLISAVIFYAGAGAYALDGAMARFGARRIPVIRYALG
jgi:thiosulfate dehydrogenase (quinone) large subunit